MRSAYKILVRKATGRDHLGNMGIDGRIRLKLTLKQGMSVDWIQLAQDMVHW
jgi:hypothetical protein